MADYPAAAPSELAIGNLGTFLTLKATAPTLKPRAIFNVPEGAFIDFNVKYPVSNGGTAAATEGGPPVVTPRPPALRQRKHYPISAEKSQTTRKGGLSPYE